MSGVRKGGSHAMVEVSTHSSGGSRALLVEQILERSFSEIRDEAIEAGVFKVGMSKEDLAEAIAISRG